MDVEIGFGDVEEQPVQEAQEQQAPQELALQEQPIEEPQAQELPPIEQPHQEQSPHQPDQVDDTSFGEPEQEVDNVEAAVVEAESDKRNLLVGVKKPAKPKRGVARAPTANPVRSLQERQAAAEPEAQRQVPPEPTDSGDKRPSTKRPPPGSIFLVSIYCTLLHYHSIGAVALGGMAAIAGMAAMKRAKQLEDNGRSPAEDDSEGVSGSRGTLNALLRYCRIHSLMFTAEVVEELKPEAPSVTMQPMGYMMPGMSAGGLAALKAKLRSSQRPKGAPCLHLD